MSRQTGADDAGFTPRSRSIQVEEFEVAIPGGIWVAIGGQMPAEQLLSWAAAWRPNAAWCEWP